MTVFELFLVLALTTHCTMTGSDKSGVLLSCDNAERSELRIPLDQWPSEWHGPELGFRYELNVLGGPIPSKQDLTKLASERERQLNEIRRWRIPPTQTSGNELDILRKRADDATPAETRDAEEWCDLYRAVERNRYRLRN